MPEAYYLVARRAIRELEGNEPASLDEYCDPNTEKYSCMVDLFVKMPSRFVAPLNPILGIISIMPPVGLSRAPCERAFCQFGVISVRLPGNFRFHTAGKAPAAKHHIPPVLCP